MVGFDLARTFHPSERLGRATGVVNIGGFTASLLAMAGIGLVLDLRAPGGPDTYTTADFKAAMSVQFLFWGVGSCSWSATGAKGASSSPRCRGHRGPAGRRSPAAGHLTPAGRRAGDAR